MSVFSIELPASLLKVDHGLALQDMCIQSAEEGYEKDEPGPCLREISQLFEKVVDALKKEGIARADVSESLPLRTEGLDALTFGLVLTGISGGREDDARTLGPRKHLQIVTSSD